jgi:capsular exopolysaccharide synthesis family protein
MSPVAPLYTEFAPQEDAIDLKDLAYTIWEGKWWVLVTFAVIVAIAMAWVFTRAPEYQSYTLLLVSTDQGPVSTGLTTGLEDALGLQNRTIQNEILIIQQSLSLSEEVAEQVQLIRNVPGTEEPLPALYDQEGERLSTASLAQRVSRMIQVGAVGDEVDAIRITARSTSREEAALIANLFAAEYIERTQESSRARISASRDFLEQQEAERRAQLQGLEDEVRSYMTRSGAIALDQEATATVSQIAQLEAARDEARIELGMSQASLAAIEDELAELEPRIAQRIASGIETELQRVQQERVSAEFQLQEILAENPRLSGNLQSTPETARLADRIARLEAREQELATQFTQEVLSMGGVDVSAEGGGLGYVAQRRQQIAQQTIAISGLQARIDAINARLASLQNKMQTIPAQAIELAQLQRARQSVERLYVYIVEKLQEVRIAEQSEIGYAEVVRPALVPDAPVFPNKSRTVAIAALLGLVLGAGLVLLRKNLDTRLHTPGDLRELGQTVLGVIPDMRKRIKEDFGGKETIEVDGVLVSTTAAVLLDPMSSTTEAYRRLRTNIQFSRPDTIVQTILLSSPEMGEGKSTTAVNLALAMAQANRRVCLVDCDLRRPRLHKYLGQEREPGLSGLLFAPEGSFDPEAFRLPIDDLFLIPAGAKVPNPAEVLGSKRMREFIETLRGHFDVILFDTPPLLAFSEAMLLATQCDGTVIVSTADKTDRDAFNHAVDMLTGVGAPILGGVLNGVDISKQQRYGYGYYKYRYGYRYYGYGYYNRENASNAQS